jgi:hypothetical protein
MTDLPALLADLHHLAARACVDDLQDALVDDR